MAKFLHFNHFSNNQSKEICEKQFQFLAPKGAKLAP